ncbi:transposase [Candidatus Poribacteria bacterium]|nr:transposase [Candidatus Poribacteria bacterium]
MIDIIFQFPKSAVYFFRFSRKYINKAVYRHTIAMVLAIILIRGSRNYANVTRLFLDSRSKSSISRCFTDSVFPGFVMQEHLYERLLTEASSISGKTAHIIIDSTAQKKQGKKMENTIIYKKGYTCDHFFVMGMVYFPGTQVRIPLPRRLYHTKAYCRKHNIKYRTQVQLAEMMLRYAVLPKDMKVVVVFDSFFPSKSLIDMIKQKGYHFVCSAKKNRVDSETGKPLNEICEEHISKGHIKDRVDIRVPSKRSRYNHSSAERYETKTFITYTEKHTISKMGEVKVVFSHKEGKNVQLKDMRYILTDMLDLTTSQILTIYTYRWQIELFFKELKSYLGFGNYQMLTFKAIIRHVDCVIMAFMYLEHLRICKLKQNPGDKRWLYSRTLQMSYVLQHELRLSNLKYLKRYLKDEKGFSELERKLIEKIPLVA